MQVSRRMGEGGFQAPPPNTSKGRRSPRYRAVSVPFGGKSGGTADRILFALSLLGSGRFLFGGVMWNLSMRRAVMSGRSWR